MLAKAKVNWPYLVEYMLFCGVLIYVICTVFKLLTGFFFQFEGNEIVDPLLKDFFVNKWLEGNFLS